MISNDTKEFIPDSNLISNRVTTFYFHLMELDLVYDE